MSKLALCFFVFCFGRIYAVNDTTFKWKLDIGINNLPKNYFLYEDEDYYNMVDYGYHAVVLQKFHNLLFREGLNGNRYYSYRSYVGNRIITSVAVEEGIVLPLVPELYVFHVELDGSIYEEFKKDKSNVVSDPTDYTHSGIYFGPGITAGFRIWNIELNGSVNLLGGYYRDRNMDTGSSSHGFQLTSVRSPAISVRYIFR